MITEEQKRMIESNAMALATVGEDGKPHVIAVGFAKVRDGKIIITDNYMGQTPRNIRNDASVALAVWSRDWEDNCSGFEFRGRAEYQTSGKWLDFVRSLPENDGERPKAAIVVTVEKVKKLA